MTKTPRTLLNLLRSYNRYKTRAMSKERVRYAGEECEYSYKWALCIGNYFIDCPLVKYLGSGSFAVVVECEGRVFKIIKRSDDAYDAFYQFCQAIGPNRYLPVFKGKWTIRGFTIYELEKLNQFLSVDHRDTICNMPSCMSEEHPELQAIISLMYEYKETLNVSWDLHQGNFATRDKYQLVIIDPWA